ncbi:hypothetical protein C1H46_031398 [Malus baccata]|uniref:Uncharacterized protein n=1 Tax=Malus baccata TaxID=106549 RepID=A0A540L9U0_MALBA|nr:hypothetical protein C1H46_031398 [Malus baccata]
MNLNALGGGCTITHPTPAPPSPTPQKTQIICNQPKIWVLGTRRSRKEFWVSMVRIRRTRKPTKTRL